MNFVRGVIGEVFGMFVDDGALALAILGWVAAFALLQKVAPIGHNLAGVLLFAGLAAILIDNVLRRGRNR